MNKIEQDYRERFDIKYNLDNFITDEDKILHSEVISFIRLKVVEELGKHIEHPTKPGYRRLDIVARIKELKKEL